jgi:hypothetical protein
MPDFGEPRKSSQIVGSSANVRKLLENSIARGTEISERDMYNNEPVRKVALADIEDWNQYNLQCLRQAFTGDQEWKEYPTRLNIGNPATYLIQDDIEIRLRYLRNLKDRIDLYSEAMSQGSRSISAPVINIHGGQVQMATGEYSQQTMNVGLAAEQLVLVINGLAEILRGLRLDAAQAMALERAEQDAIEDVTSERPSGQGVKRFNDWVLRCVKQGGNAALTAAVTAAANGMLHDAEQLARAIRR